MLCFCRLITIIYKKQEKKIKKVLIGIFFLCAGILFSQDKRTYFHAEMDMIIPNDKKVVYSFSEGEIKLGERIM